MLPLVTRYSTSKHPTHTRSETMLWNSARILIVLSICGIVISSPERPVDCRKFVFAPLCRGVAAKRGPADTHRFATSAIYMNSKTFKEFLKNLYLDVGFLKGDPDDEDDKNTLKKVQRQLDDSIYKLFQGNRGNSGDAENVMAVHEYENL